MRKIIKKTKSNPDSYVIGITGSFGTGKSFVGSVLKNQGICVVDTDYIVRGILSTKNKITKTLAEIFGNKILNKSKSEYINRKILAGIVFNDADKRKRLEKIIHPEVRKKIKSLILHNHRYQIIAVLVPLLFESNMAGDFDEIWTVYCSKKKQVARLMKRGFTQKDIKARIKTQLALSQKVKKADYVINNSGSMRDTKNKVLARIKELVQLNRNHRLFSCKQY